MNDITNTIKELELSLLKPKVRSSKETLDKLLADDFVEFGTSGNKYVKAGILERLPNSPDRYEYVMSDFTVVMPSEDIAITTFRTDRTINGKDRVISQRTSHWRKSDHGWQIYYHKGQPIK